MSQGDILQRFEKRSLDVQEQITLLENRGLLVTDHTRAIHYLRTIGYYRLSAYFKPYQQNNSDQFNPGIEFDQILDLYILDRRLRLIMVDAFERIEVAIRSLISNTLCERYNDPFWHLNDSIFAPHYTESKNGKKSQHEKLINDMEWATGKKIRKKEMNLVSTITVHTMARDYHHPGWSLKPCLWELGQRYSLV